MQAQNPLMPNSNSITSCVSECLYASDDVRSNNNCLVQKAENGCLARGRFQGERNWNITENTEVRSLLQILGFLTFSTTHQIVVFS